MRNVGTKVCLAKQSTGADVKLRAFLIPQGTELLLVVQTTGSTRISTALFSSQASSDFRVRNT